MTDSADNTTGTTDVIVIEHNETIAVDIVVEAPTVTQDDAPTGGDAA